mgnify:CR=1 FL=1
MHISIQYCPSLRLGTCWISWKVLSNVGRSSQGSIIKSRDYEEEINKTTVTDKDTFMQQAGQELEDMNTKYNGAKALKLKMELING